MLNEKKEGEDKELEGQDEKSIDTIDGGGGGFGEKS